MSNDQNVQRNRLELVGVVEEILSRLPEGVEGTVSIRDPYVYLMIQGSRLATFTLVLGSEAPEVVYDGQYIRIELIPPGMEAQFDFAKETADSIVEFLLSDRIPVEGKSRVLGRPYLSIPMAEGTVWKLKKFD